MFADLDDPALPKAEEHVVLALLNPGVRPFGMRPDLGRNLVSFGNFMQPEFVWLLEIKVSRHLPAMRLSQAPRGLIYRLDIAGDLPRRSV